MAPTIHNATASQATLTLGLIFALEWVFALQACRYACCPSCLLQQQGKYYEVALYVHIINYLFI